MLVIRPKSDVLAVATLARGAPKATLGAATATPQRWESPKGAGTKGR